MHFGAILGPGVVYKLMKAEKCLFSAKIADLQKFRLRNFGRGVSGAAEKKFLNYKYKLLSPKKFSWSYENFKFVSQKSWGDGKGSPLPNNENSNFGEIVAKRDIYCLKSV